MTDHDISLWSMISSVSTLAVAIAAALSWWETLKNQRADDCVGSVTALQSAIGQVLSAAKSNSNSKWTDYDQAWQRQADMAKAFAIESRYSGTRLDYLVEFTYILTELEKVCNHFSEDAAKEIAERCSRAVGVIVHDRRPGAFIRAVMWRPKWW